MSIASAGEGILAILPALLLALSIATSAFAAPMSWGGGGGGGGGGGSGTVNSGTAAQQAYYPANGTAVSGATPSGDCIWSSPAVYVCTKTNGTALTGAATMALPVAVGNGGLNTSTAPSAAQIPIAQSGTAYAPKTMSGDATIGSTGAVTNIGIDTAPLPTPIPTPAANATGVHPVFPGGSSTASWVSDYDEGQWESHPEVLGAVTSSKIVWIYSCTHEIDFAANFTGGGAGTYPLNVSFTAVCGTAPTATSTYTLKGTGASGVTMNTLGTIALGTGAVLGTLTAPTLTGSGGCASGTCVACVAGGALAVYSGTTQSEADCTWGLTGQGQMQ